MVNDPKMYISGYKLYPTLTDITVNVSIQGGSGKITLTAIDQLQVKE